MNIKYKQNTLTQNELYSFLKSSDLEFQPILSSRVNLFDYSKKIIKNANLFEAYYNSEVIAIVAVYANDLIKNNAYITYVYCKKEYRTQGITKSLICQTLSYLKDRNFQSVSLEVSITNNPAVSLYKKFDFIIERQKNDTKIIMTRNI